MRTVSSEVYSNEQQGAVGFYKNREPLPNPTRSGSNIIHEENEPLRGLCAVRDLPAVVLKGSFCTFSLHISSPDASEVAPLPCGSQLAGNHQTKSPAASVAAAPTAPAAVAASNVYCRVFGKLLLQQY